MDKSSNFRYLSWRVMATGAGALALIAFLTVVYAAALPYGVPRWPLVAAFIALALLLAAAYFLIVRPYLRHEHMTRLFLEGYTLSSLNLDRGAALSPGDESMHARMRTAFSEPNLLKLSQRQAQYRMLQNQINPHFLYNTLESIRSEALIAGLDSVADMTEALAVFFRYTISKVEDLVSLEEELQNCRTYFSIQQYRFGKRLQLHILCDEAEREELYRCRLPKLTLQPIIENSIIHGTEFKVGAGKITVEIARTQKRLLIRVSDDGIGMDEATLARLNERLGKSSRAFQDDHSEQKGGLALVNVNNRIHLLFGEEFGLTVCSMPGIGTDVHILLPIITSDRDTVGGGVF